MRNCSKVTTIHTYQCPSRGFIVGHCNLQPSSTVCYILMLSLDFETNFFIPYIWVDCYHSGLSSELSNKIKRTLFYAIAVSVLLYGCNNWAIKKRLKKTTRWESPLLWCVFFEALSHKTTVILPISKIIQGRRTRDAEHCWRSNDELISDILL